MSQHEVSSRLLDGRLFNTFYNMQLSSNRRFHTSFSLVFISAPPEHSVEWEAYLQKRVRDTDIAFRFPTPLPYQVLLTNATQKEAEVFVVRILEGWEESGHIARDIRSSILLISSGQSPSEDVMETGRNALKQAWDTGDTLPYVVDTTFAIREHISIKVSIVEEDPLVTRVLTNLLERSVIDGIDLTIKVFHDGHSFLESAWYQSPDTHIIILNDILPKKNGLEVLYKLRSLPNERKFHIFMMTKRMSEEEMIYAYEHGVDEYIIKPFNPKLFEAQVKKVLGRLYI